ncbi:hypothetical protein D9M70_617110 [compost metagenome]
MREGPQRDQGKGGAPVGDDGGIGLDQGPEDAGQTEQHCGNMRNDQGVATGRTGTGFRKV